MSSNARIEEEVDFFLATLNDAQLWRIIEFYQSPREADFNHAMLDFQQDVESLIAKIRG